ncbi:hypothetical protein VHUM_03915 [Vanrija humicola]|uniref:C2 domain-containing protein n=1 Tax=Vanrija humicola TaxID=5417 RepID=A0A7D8UWS2_VANHU|nr:hypothetical protein VHUM_03915 [Vanrija humicola]
MASATLVTALTASGGAETPGFLNDIVEQLWPNLATAVADMIKTIVEPMFATILPSPLSSLKFVDLNLGDVPMRFTNVDVHKTASGAIKLDLDLDWDGACDISLDGKMVPRVGIEKLKLAGRLSILLGPLTNVLPLIGAAQVTFINPPYLKFTYTDAGAIANLGFIDKQIRGIIQGVIASMAVLPNRFLVKLDVTNDWFKTYQHPLGVVRLTVESATSLGQDKAAKGFFGKLVHDVPDAHATVILGETFQTKTVSNSRDPVWNETHDFLLSDNDQKLIVEVTDSDTTSDDALGQASTTIKNLLLQGGKHELTLNHNGTDTDGKIKIAGQFYKFVPNAASLSSQDPGIHGLLTVLVASAHNIEGDRSKLKPSVAVKWGASSFRTGVKADASGVDVRNPNYDAAFTVPLTAAVTVTGAEPLRFVLMDGENEVTTAELPLDKVLSTPELSFTDHLELAGGASIRVSVTVRGTEVMT